jgi:hypothetical protein
MESAENRLIFEKKIEYLNDVLIKTKKLAEDREGQVVALIGKIEDQENEIMQITEEKNAYENEWQIVKTELTNLKMKAEIAFEDILIEKDREISELKKKIEMLSDSSSRRNRSGEKVDELRELRERMVEQAQILQEIRENKSLLDLSSTNIRV